MIWAQTSAAMANELQARLPDNPLQPFHMVFENDLLGRAALAILWQYRSHMIMYLISDNPSQDHVAALISGIENLRERPSIKAISHREAAAIAQYESNLVWAVDRSRTPAAVMEILGKRKSKTTWTPFFEPYEALNNKHAKQTPHELVLRDIIREHARFLNFFGDRFNSKDLYQRAKYPSWFSPPADVSAAIPPVKQITNVNGHVVDSTEFVGTLQLPANQKLAGCNAMVELSPVFEALETGKYDAVITIRNSSFDAPASGALTVQIHRENRLVASIDTATSPSEIEVPLPAVTAGTGLSVSLTSRQDIPTSSTVNTSATHISVAILPRGTYWRASHALKAWFQRFRWHFGVQHD